MATNIPISFCSFIFFFYLSCFCSINSFHFDYATQADCLKTANTDGYHHYFDAARMVCEKCKQKSSRQIASSDGLSCVCQKGMKITYSTINVHRTFELFCVPCGQDEVPTEDGWGCMKCPNNERPIDQFKCDKCSGDDVLTAERSLNGTPFADRVMNCVTCEDGTRPTDGRCQPCRDIQKIGVKTCKCPKDNLVGGVCFARRASSNFEASIEVGDSKVDSVYLAQNAPAAIEQCKKRYKNETACQHVANMCALQMFSTQGGACNKYNDLWSEEYGYDEKVDGPTQTLPWMYIRRQQGDLVLDGIEGGQIPVKFGFQSNIANSKLNFVLAKYSPDGHFIGWINATGGLLQLCADKAKRIDAAYEFGTQYVQSCEIPGLQLFEKDRYQLAFYDIYIKYTEGKKDRVYIVPVLNVNLKTDSGTPNTGQPRNSRTSTFRGVSSRWYLVRRFFLVDNIATVASTDAQPCGLNNKYTASSYVRYPESISFHIRLREDEEDGKGYIYPPYMRIKYGFMSCADALAGDMAKIAFKVEYEMSEEEYDKNFKIGAGTLGTLMVLYAAYRTWVWSKRAGRIAIDFLAIINFVFQACGALSHAFLVLTFGSSFYWLMFYKNQEYAFIVLPEKWAYINFLTLLGCAFALKSLHLAYIIFMQCTTDVFLIDWERPRAAANIESGQKKADSTVSVWRTYFVANEYNELQATRRMSSILQILVTVFFLEVVGFVNMSSTDNNTSIYASADEYHGPQSHIFRYTISTLIYLIVAVVQYICVAGIYNQFIENPIHSFVDLCSMSNVSVFVMAHAQYGYYIHGRSVHGKGDADLRDMHEMMKREEEDLCGQRGLLPNSEQQTFEMSLPWRLRAKYDQMYLPIALQDAGGGRGEKGSRIAGTSSEKTVTAYLNMNKFLSAFIDHSLREIDYVVKDKSLMEKILNTEFLDSMERGIFYNDNGHAFTDVLFYGSEITLLLFDLLCFAVVDLIFTNYVLSGIVTFFIGQVVIKVRQSGGRRNLARKTLVDERFLI